MHRTTAIGAEESVKSRAESSSLLQEERSAFRETQLIEALTRAGDRIAKRATAVFLLDGAHAPGKKKGLGKDNALTICNIELAILQPSVAQFLHIQKQKPPSFL